MTNLQDRILSKVQFDTNGGCWIWSGALRGKGYGQVHVEGVSVAAHRASYELSVGPIPEGMLVCHSCDVKQCVNPKHLYVGSNAINMTDAALRGRLVQKAASGIAGAYFHDGEWVSRISIDGKTQYLGRFKTKEEAGVAYQLAVSEKLSTIPAEGEE